MTDDSDDSDESLQSLLAMASSVFESTVSGSCGICDTFFFLIRPCISRSDRPSRPKMLFIVFKKTLEILLHCFPYP